VAGGRKLVQHPRSFPEQIRNRLSGGSDARLKRFAGPQHAGQQHWRGGSDATRIFAEVLIGKALAEYASGAVLGGNTFDFRLKRLPFN
jgi:hypothetical protein